MICNIIKNQWRIKNLIDIVATIAFNSNAFSDTFLIKKVATFLKTFFVRIHWYFEAIWKLKFKNTKLSKPWPKKFKFMISFPVQFRLKELSFLS